MRVVKLTDAEAIEAQCVENLQREDIHPLEEALGFKSLLELGEPYNIAPCRSQRGQKRGVHLRSAQIGRPHSICG